MKERGSLSCTCWYRHRVDLGSGSIGGRGGEVVSESGCSTDVMVGGRSLTRVSVISFSTDTTEAKESDRDKSTLSLTAA
jgi:hypothetical protein